MQSSSLEQGLCCYEISESTYRGDGNMLKVLLKHFFTPVARASVGPGTALFKDWSPLAGSSWYLFFFFF